MTYTRGGSKRELTVISAYLSYDSDEPPLFRGLREVIDYCGRSKLQLIIGCDASAHHIIRGSRNINPWLAQIVIFLIKVMKLLLKLVTDLSLGADKIGDLVTNWRVCDEISLLDHR